MSSYNNNNNSVEHNIARHPNQYMQRSGMKLILGGINGINFFIFPGIFIPDKLKIKNSGVYFATFRAFTSPLFPIPYLCMSFCSGDTGDGPDSSSTAKQRMSLNAILKLWSFI